MNPASLSWLSAIAVWCFDDGAFRAVTLDLWVVVENDIKQRAVDFNFPVVTNETELSEFVHEKAHAGTRCSDHLGKYFLADVGDDRFGFAFFAEIGKQEQGPGKSFLAGIK